MVVQHDFPVTQTVIPKRIEESQILCRGTAMCSWHLRCTQNGPDFASVKPDNREDDSDASMVL